MQPTKHAFWVAGLESHVLQSLLLDFCLSFTLKLNNKLKTWQTPQFVIKISTDYANRQTFAVGMTLCSWKNKIHAANKKD